MNIVPSERGALLAGLWSGLGLLPLTRVEADGAWGNVLWVATLVVFFFAPMYLLVFGRGEKFGRDWIFDPIERARYGAMIKRMLVWALGAAATAGAVALALRLL